MLKPGEVSAEMAPGLQSDKNKIVSLSRSYELVVDCLGKRMASLYLLRCFLTIWFLLRRCPLYYSESVMIFVFFSYKESHDSLDKTTGFLKKRFSVF